MKFLMVGIPLKNYVKCGSCPSQLFKKKLKLEKNLDMLQRRGS